MSAKRASTRPRREVSPALMRLLKPIYRRSESRSVHDGGSVYVLRGVGHRIGPVLRIGARG